MPIAMQTMYTPAKKNQRQTTNGVQKRTPKVNSGPRTAGIRSSPRLHLMHAESGNVRLPVEPRQLLSQSQPLPPSLSPPTPVTQLAVTKRKRTGTFDSNLEADENNSCPSQKHNLLREDRQERFEAGVSEHQVLSSQNRLSKRNLQTLARLNGEDVDSVHNSAPVVTTLKKASSRRSKVPSETGTDRTQRSLNSTAVYRHKVLSAVEVHLHAEPPGYIQSAIDRITDAEVSKERRSEIRVIAQQWRDGCMENVKAQAGENDFIDPIHTAIKSLGLRNLCTHVKADWKAELNPVVPLQSLFSSNFMSGVQQYDVDDIADPPPKRHQRSVDVPYTFPEHSLVNTIIPASDYQDTSTTLPPGSRGTSIKAPSPDLSIGIELTALISALSSPNFSRTMARTFLAWLQDEMVQHRPDGPLRPMLVPVPAPRALDLAFPFAVVEGKAYSTGKKIFEAENQASISGACGLKIQLDLNNLLDRGVNATTDATSNTEPPLFFTICTQGPIHELWAHWTVVEDDVRSFGSKLLDSCNALLLGQGEAFLVRPGNLGLWGVGPFMDSVVERLQIVAAKAKVS